MPASKDHAPKLDPHEIRGALERVTASPPFDTSPRLTSFLRFVVESTLVGRGDRLKGYTIGVEALGRDGTFDPQTDPIVRVGAVRLRRALARYYTGAGTRDPVVIDLPRGCYAPRFRRRESGIRGGVLRLLQAIRAAQRVLGTRVTIVFQRPAERR